MGRPARPAVLPSARELLYWGVPGSKMLCKSALRSGQDCAHRGGIERLCLSGVGGRPVCVQVRPEGLVKGLELGTRIELQPQCICACRDDSVHPCVQQHTAASSATPVGPDG
jgi:hypothetical protein